MITNESSNFVCKFVSKFQSLANLLRDLRPDNIVSIKSIIIFFFGPFTGCWLTNIMEKSSKTNMQRPFFIRGMLHRSQVMFEHIVNMFTVLFDTNSNFKFRRNVF